MISCWVGIAHPTTALLLAIFPLILSTASEYNADLGDIYYGTLDRSGSR